MNTYSLDMLNSEINFTAKLFNSDVKGTFESFDASLQIDGLTNLTKSDISVVIDVASLNTKEPMRDQHLKSADFFHADKYPKMSFIKTRLEQHSNTHFTITGLLTIKYITKYVSFNVHMNKYANSVLSGFTFQCSSVINRHEFGLSYNPAFEKVNGLDDLVRIEATFSIQPI